MKFVKAIILSLLFFAITIQPAHAIIAIIPIILIPIVNVVVWVIAALSTPVVALSALYFKMKKKSPIIGIIVGILILILLGFAITIIMKVMNPARPIY